MTATFYPSSKQAEKLFQQTYFIPVSAVSANESGGDFVSIVNDETKQVEQRLVEVGTMSGDDIVILSGLKPRERIVTAGASYLRSNMKVRLFDEKVGY